jgi:hypothetical protein
VSPKPVTIPLTARAVDVHGSEIGRSHWNAVARREELSPNIMSTGTKEYTGPLHFIFEPPLDPKRVGTIVIDVDEEACGRTSGCS